MLRTPDGEIRVGAHTTMDNTGIVDVFDGDEDGANERAGVAGEGDVNRIWR